ncbi:MAG: hypothetical protein EVJ46_02620 [Candidatus Acididesulfobacter guangdongensis]|uniref:Uncharacterized protein n=1 Tax=Acididesulfobacter guangdongensis TaxID=2597225 RepID=A0A519BIP4_ACIG2|nr:MAG: hypothetical protein EVJ46_02620 [Candidatus Acididesulfobacter guangdongensis]
MSEYEMVAIAEQLDTSLSLFGPRSAVAKHIPITVQECNILEKDPCILPNTAFACTTARLHYLAMRKIQGVSVIFWKNNLFILIVRNIIIFKKQININFDCNPAYFST